MIRDGVCDEVANIERCLYDGGDCCKENKDKDLCRDCQCILFIDQENVESQFNELDIKPVSNTQDLETAIARKGGWTIYVENVLNVQVCTVLCLDHKKAEELNAWRYHANNQSCKCGWVESKSCPETMVLDTEITDISLIANHQAFVQLKKTVPCGKYTADI